MAQISVIVPVYKSEKFLHRCVDSILSQTFQDLELILMDDGSPDTSGAICDAYGEKDSRVHVIHQENTGVCVARNNALDWVYANSDSQWIYFIDNDDWMHPQTLELLHKAAVENGLKISIASYGETQGENPLVKAEDMTPVIWQAGEYYQQHFVNATVCWGKLYHRDCFDGRRYPPGKYIEDEFLTYKLLFESQQLAVIPAPLYAYYFNPTGISKKKWIPKRMDAWEAYEQQIAFFQERGEQDLVRFRYRNYLESIMLNITAAEEDKEKFAAEIRVIEKRARNVIRRAWKAGGVIEFWFDSEMLNRFYPILTPLCLRFFEWRIRWRNRKK